MGCLHLCRLDFNQIIDADTEDWSFTGNQAYDDQGSLGRDSSDTICGIR